SPPDCFLEWTVEFARAASSNASDSSLLMLYATCSTSCDLRSLGHTHRARTTRRRSPLIGLRAPTRDGMLAHRGGCSNAVATVPSSSAITSSVSLTIWCKTRSMLDLSWLWSRDWRASARRGCLPSVAKELEPPGSRCSAPAGVTSNGILRAMLRNRQPYE